MNIWIYETSSPWALTLKQAALSLQPQLWPHKSMTRRTPTTQLSIDVWISPAVYESMSLSVYESIIIIPANNLAVYASMDLWTLPRLSQFMNLWLSPKRLCLLLSRSLPLYLCLSSLALHLPALSLWITETQKIDSQSTVEDDDKDIPHWLFLFLPLSPPLPLALFVSVCSLFLPFERRRKGVKETRERDRVRERPRSKEKE